MSTQHSITQAQWNQLSFCEQMGNIGSEISRTISASKRSNFTRADSAFDRALELFDLTISDPKNKHGLKELCRAREICCDFFIGDNDYRSEAESLDRYFLQYAQAARK